MIHDLLLSCLNLRNGSVALERIMHSGAIEAVFHPCEKEILGDIIVLINSFRDAERFAKVYGIYESRRMLYPKIKTDDDRNFLREGIYLRAFCSGIEDLLELYYFAIREMEIRYLKNPTHSIMLVYQKLHEFSYLGYVADHVIRGIQRSQYHGCSLLQFVHRCSEHGDPDTATAIKMCLSPVLSVFLRQLTNWILYAKIGDPFKEFFIQPTAEDEENLSVSMEIPSISSDHFTSDITSDTERNNSFSSNKHSESLSDNSADFDSIWQYEIVYEMIPRFISTEYAEKIFFIGQTVLIFKVDALNSEKAPEDIFADEGEFSLWNDKEKYFYERIQGLKMQEIRAHNFEVVVDEIKEFVTRRLLEIAINKADLVTQLNLIKEVYLLGRGELFLEFIRLSHAIERDDSEENKLAQYIKAFESAAGSIGVTDELDQFTLRVTDDMDLDISTEFGFIQQIRFEYAINWPLHLLFSPKVLERYNVLFRFLLLIKKLQFDLHSVWALQNVYSKCKVTINNKVVRLRNHLMFFIDNLQYYIQVDVLESQFSILKSTIASKTDFEQIQKAHSVFQANILSLCFLLMDDEPDNITLSRGPSLVNAPNPVYAIINEICHIVKDFCLLIENEQTTKDYAAKINNLDERYGILIEQLTDVFLKFKASTCATPLSQFLLRLDYNRWFSGSKADKKPNSKVKRRK